MHWYNHMSWGWGGGLMMILWIVLLIALIFWSVRAVQSNQPRQAESAMDILKKRFARGEISKEEFEERKKELL